MTLSLTLLSLTILWAVALWLSLKYSWIDNELDRFGAFLDRIDHDKTPALLWVVGFFSLTQVRDFLENFVEQPEIISSFSMRIEYLLWWSLLYFWMAIYLRIITRESIVRISKLIAICFFVIYIAPVVDPIVYRGHSFTMTYVLQDLVKNFITFYGYCEYGMGATVGIKIEIMLVCLAAGLYVATKTRSALKTSFSMLMFYAFCYVFMAIPMIANLIMSNFVKNFNLSNHPGKMNYFIGPVTGISFLVYLYMAGKDRAGKLLQELSRLFHFKAFKLDSEIFIALLKNIRPFRLAHYNLMVLAGLFVALNYAKGTYQHQIPPALNIILLHLSISFSWLFAVGVNDLYDISIDRISNKNRPLIKGSVTIENYKIFTFFALCLSILFSSLLGFRIAGVVFYFTLAYSFLYSAPPFRLKRFIMIPNLLIGLCNLIAFLCGMVLVFGSEAFLRLPRNTAWFIFIAISILSLVKDLKDEQGDMRSGIMTLPALIGIDRAKWIVGGLVAAVFLLSPLYMQFSYNWVFAILCGLCGFWVVTRNKDWLFFAVWDIFLIVVCVIMGIKYLS